MHVWPVGVLPLHCQSQSEASNLDAWVNMGLYVYMYLFTLHYIHKKCILYNYTYVAFNLGHLYCARVTLAPGEHAGSCSVVSGRHASAHNSNFLLKAISHRRLFQ